MIRVYGQRLNCSCCGVNRFVPESESPLELTTFINGWATWFDIFAAQHAHGGIAPKLKQHVSPYRLMHWGMA